MPSIRPILSLAASRKPLPARLHTRSAARHGRRAADQEPVPQPEWGGDQEHPDRQRQAVSASLPRAHYWRPHPGRAGSISARKDPHTTQRAVAVSIADAAPISIAVAIAQPAAVATPAAVAGVSGVALPVCWQRQPLIGRLQGLLQWRVQVLLVLLCALLDLHLPRVRQGSRPTCRGMPVRSLERPWPCAVYVAAV